MMTFEEGLRRTCRLPLFSALLMHLRAEANESINTMVNAVEMRKTVRNTLENLTNLNQSLKSTRCQRYSQIFHDENETHLYV